jgi:hypothetical protein
MLKLGSERQIRSLFLLSVTLTIAVYGCARRDGSGGSTSFVGRDSNNLQHVKCKQTLGGGTVEISVDASAYALKRDDQIVFVCKGEVVVWKIADSHVASFAVTFKNNEWPFGNSPVTLPSNSGGATTGQTVFQVNGKFAKAYEYTITVTRTDGTTVTVDPHVIPMGG